MNLNKVSIVIPVYNSEIFLKESMDSILNQSYKNIEVIVVNDGSTDNSQQILEEYSNKITVINQKNSGLASALITGIKHSSGKWFKWFSPDDVMFPDTIETLVHEAEKYSDTIVYSNWEIIDEKGNKLREFYESNYNELSEYDYNIRLLDGQLINVNTTLIPSKIFEKSIIFENLDDPVAIDYDFFLRCAILNKTKFHLISKSLIQYRIHLDQLSRKNISKTLNYVEKIKLKVLSNLSEKEKIKYLVELKKYQKSKSVEQKIIQLGLKILSNGPTQISDRVLNLYLSKIRRSR